MHSSHTRHRSFAHRVAMLVVCVGLLSIFSSYAAAQQPLAVKVTPKPSSITDAAKPETVTLHVTDPNGNELTSGNATAFGNDVGFVKVGDTDPLPVQIVGSDITFTPPAKLSGTQTVQVLDKSGQSRAQTQLLYPAPPSQTTPDQTGGTAGTKSDNKSGDVGDVVWSVLYRLILAGLLVYLLINSNLTINHVIRFSRSSFRNALGFPVGSFRAMLAYTLVAYLGIYIVASVLGFRDVKPPDSILGIVATVIGFYFGTRSTEETEGSGPAGLVRGVVKKGTGPARGAIVKFKRDDGTEPYTRVADVDGHFTGVRTKPGKYKVTATLTGLPPASVDITTTEDSDQEIEIVINDGTPVPATPPTPPTPPTSPTPSPTPTPPTPPPPTATNGTVVVTVSNAADGSPVQGAEVVLTQAGNDLKKTTDADGKVTFENLPAGDCNITATLNTTTSPPTAVTVTPGASTPVDIKLALP